MVTAAASDSAQCRSDTSTASRFEVLVLVPRIFVINALQLTKRSSVIRGKFPENAMSVHIKSTKSCNSDQYPKIENDMLENDMLQIPERPSVKSVPLRD